MHSRRRFLEAAGIAGAGLLSGCSFLGSGASGTRYPESVPAPSTLPDYTMTRTARYDLAAVRDRNDLRHSECDSWVVGCTPLIRDVVANDRLFLDVADVDAVAVGGATRLNSHPYSLASPTGTHLFKIYQYSADAGRVSSALEEQYSPGSSVGGFQTYTGSSGRLAANSVLAHDGSRLIVGLEGVTNVVAQRLNGQHQSYAAEQGRSSVRDHLESSDHEIVESRQPQDASDAEWYEQSSVVGRSVAFGETSVTYRFSHRFPTAEMQQNVADGAVRTWASNRLRPFDVQNGPSKEDVSIERDDRTLAVAVDSPTYLGIV